MYEVSARAGYQTWTPEVRKVSTKQEAEQKAESFKKNGYVCITITKTK